MRRKHRSEILIGLCITTILLSCLVFGASCTKKPLVLPEDERIFVVKDAAPMFDGKAYDWSEVEGWYIFAPGNVVEYMRWLIDEKKRRELEDVPE